ncbi:YcdB/YcdC domain-containing protein [Brevibacillus borstelensis]|uniref:YcdB/YcdC domain-containing protein n=1 Tax=Brevibacillus borstelensis TaxID=45462 RepID=UPI0030C3B3FC
MHLENDDSLHQQLKELNRRVPAPKKEARERLLTMLAKKARQMDQTKGSEAYVVFALKAASFLFVAALGAVLAIPSAEQIPMASSPLSSVDDRQEPETSVATPKQQTADQKHPQTNTKKPDVALEQTANTQPTQSRRSSVAPPGSPSIHAPSATAPGRTAESTDNTAGVADNHPAAVYLHQIIGKESRHYGLVEALSDQAKRQFVFTRMVNGVPFLDDYFVITLDDSNQGQKLMSSSNHKWTDQQAFPDPAKAISREKAEQLIADKLKLFYSGQPGEQPPAGAPAMVYDPGLMGYVNALDGQTIGDEQETSRLLGKRIEVAPAGKPLIAGTKEEAAAVLETDFGIAVGGNQQRVTDYRNHVKEYRWTVGKNSAVTVVTKESSGQIVEVEYVNHHPAGDAKTTAEEAVAIASSFLQTYLNPETNKLQVAKVEKEPSFIRITFTGIYRELPLLDDTYSVDVDPLSGKAIGFKGDFSRKNRERLADANRQSVEEAAREFVSKYPASLVYVWPKGTAAPSLVYMPLAPRILSTGQ